MRLREKLLVWLLVVAVPVGFLAWEVADFFAEPKTEREVLGENFLEHDLYADAVDELVDQHGRDAKVLVVHIDLRSAQITVVTGRTTATVEGFGERGGGNVNTGGSPVEDHERKIYNGELDSSTSLGELSIGAPRRMLAALRRHDVTVDDVVRMRLEDGAWSVLVRTGSDPDDNRRFSAGPAGQDLTPD